MKIGDLICYNGAGMKFKTLGLVLDFDLHYNIKCKKKLDKGTVPRSVLIQWCVVGKYMPRKCAWTVHRSGYGSADFMPGDTVWHQYGDWLEVVR